MKQLLPLLLVCSSGWQILIEGNKLTLKDPDAYATLQRSTTDDCAGRRTDCFQEGQFMVNVAKRSRNGARTAWVNTDVDDNTEHGGTGERVRCVVQQRTKGGAK